MNKRKQIITDVLLNDNFSNVQEFDSPAGHYNKYQNNMKKTVYLYVERDDSEYDYKAGFASYTEADDYRQECQRHWMGHCDCVYLWTGSERISLTRMPKDERNKLLKQFNIPE